MTARQTKAEKDAAAAAEQATAEPDASPAGEGDASAIPLYRDGELVPAEAESSQAIDLEAQREALDELRTSLAGLEPADVGGAIDDARQRAERTGELEQSVYLIHPVKGHVVHVTITEAVLGDMLTWADATLEDIRAAGLTA